METEVTDEKYLEGWTLFFPCVPPKGLISQYVEGRRQMPDDSPFPGVWHNRFTPYLVDIMDAMSPYSVIQHGVLMCGAQIGKTSALENICAYYMDEMPSPILFVSGTEDLAEKWSSTRLEPMIDSLGLRDKLGPSYNISKSKKTGDKTFEKLFLGGSLHIVSAQSAGGVASMSKRILLRDEIDRAPSDLKTGEGNWLSVSEARTKAWRYRKKIFDCSTPTDYYESEIFRLYELGDCRMYYVPCPKCKEFQVLEFGDQKTIGLKQIETVRGKEVVYICRNCHKIIEEFQKEWMLANGQWRPTKESSSPFCASWHLNSLYAPLAMYPWREIWEHYQASEQDPSQKKAFITLDLGLPFRDEGSRPDLEIVLSHQGAYHMGEIRPGVIFLTAGMDVQKGKEHPENLDEGPRLEMEILGHGEDYRTWSIFYKKFYGPVIDPYAGAWEELAQWCITPHPEIHKQGAIEFIRSDGIPFSVCAFFIDSGYEADITYRFCQRDPRIFTPCKGLGWITPEKLKEKGDMPGPRDILHYKITRVGGTQQLADISTNYYKSEFYNRLKTQRRILDPQNPGFCDFPLEYGKEHFEQLRAAEKRKKDGSFFSIGRDEALDCRVYAMAAGEAYVMDQLVKYHDAARRDKIPESEIRMMTPKWLLSLWAQRLSFSGART